MAIYNKGLKKQLFITLPSVYGLRSMYFLFLLLLIAACNESPKEAITSPDVSKDNTKAPAKQITTDFPSDQVPDSSINQEKSPAVIDAIVDTDKKPVKEKPAKPIDTVVNTKQTPIEEAPNEGIDSAFSDQSDAPFDLPRFFQTKPLIGEVNEVLMDDAQLKALFENKDTEDMPKGVFAHMLFMDEFLSYDFSAAYDMLFNMTELRGLDLGAYNIDSVPHAIARLENLEALILSENQLKELPDEICQLKKLRYLDVQGNQLVTLPGCLGQLTELEVLLVNRNDSLIVLPPALSALKHLRKLRLNSTGIGRRPENLQALCTLKNLEELGLSSSGSKQLPDCLQYLSKLKYFYIGSNNLKTLPPWISAMTQLEAFSFQQKDMDYDDAFRKIQPLKLVTDLSLISTDIDSIPESIALLQQLETINFYNSNIAYLPDAFFSLPKLKWLNLSQNPIKRISPKIGNMRSLTGLKLIQCQLDSLPVSIKELTALKRLKIKDNYFSEAQIDSIKLWLPETEVKAGLSVY